MKGALFDGIEGVEGAVPFGAIVSVGVKGPRGNPTRTDRFFISSTGFEDVGASGGGYRNLRHPLDPRFAEFNSLDDTDRRAGVLRGNLLFQHRDDNLNYHLLAQQLSADGKDGETPHGGGTWETPPRSMPSCVGDGKAAQRYAGMVDGEPTFLDIKCPNKLCPFRMTKKKVCGAFGRLYFRLRWPEGNPLPSLLVRYQTHGWDTVENMVGLFGAVETVADGLGMDPSSWGFAGLPFEMSVGTKKQPDKGRSFPVVKFAVEDVPAFLRWQVEQREYLIAAPRSVALIAEGSEVDESSLEAVGEAVAHITPGIPGSTDEPDPVEAEAVEIEAKRFTAAKVEKLRGSAKDLADMSADDLDTWCIEQWGVPLTELPPTRETDILAEIKTRGEMR